MDAYFRLFGCEEVLRKVIAVRRLSWSREMLDADFRRYTQQLAAKILPNSVLYAILQK